MSPARLPASRPSTCRHGQSIAAVAGYSDRPVQVAGREAWPDAKATVGRVQRLAPGVIVQGLDLESDQVLGAEDPDLGLASQHGSRDGVGEHLDARGSKGVRVIDLAGQGVASEKPRDVVRAVAAGVSEPVYDAVDGGQAVPIDEQVEVDGGALHAPPSRGRSHR
jgi:hypothetical protein